MYVSIVSGRWLGSCAPVFWGGLPYREWNFAQLPSGGDEDVGEGVAVCLEQPHTV